MNFDELQRDVSSLLQSHPHNYVEKADAIDIGRGMDNAKSHQSCKPFLDAT